MKRLALVALLFVGCQKQPEDMVSKYAYDDALRRAESAVRFAEILNNRLSRVCGRFYVPMAATSRQTNTAADIERSKQILANKEWFRACNEPWQ